MRVSGLQLKYSLVLQNKLNLQLTLMPVDTWLDNTFVPGMDVEKYFVVKLQLVGCKINITNT